MLAWLTAWHVIEDLHKFLFLFKGVLVSKLNEWGNEFLNVVWKGFYIFCFFAHLGCYL